MNLLKPSKNYYNNLYHTQPQFHLNNSSKLTTLRRIIVQWPKCSKGVVHGKKNVGVRACYNTNEERKSFLSLEEAGLVEISGLNTHERFLCRLTISSLNLLRVIAEQEGCSIEELNAGRICDWFLKDKLKREQNIGSAVLQWDDNDPFEAYF